MKLPCIETSLKPKDCLIPSSFKHSTKIIDELLTLDDYKNDPELYLSLQNGDNTIQSIQSHKHYNVRPKLKIPKKKYMESLIRNLKSGRNTENMPNSNLNPPSIYCPENSKKSYINFCAPLSKNNSLNYSKLSLIQSNSITPSKIKMCGDNILNLDNCEKSVKIGNKIKNYLNEDDNVSTSSNYYINNYFSQNKNLRNKNIKTINKNEAVKWNNPLLKSVLPSDIKTLIQNNENNLKKKIKIFRNYSGIANLRLKNKDSEIEKSENIFHLKKYDEENNSNKINRYAARIHLKKNFNVNINKYVFPICSKNPLVNSNPSSPKLYYDFNLLLINKI